MNRLLAALLCVMSLLLMPASSTSQAPDYPAQVKAIQDDAKVKAAMDYIDKNHDSILKEWIAITEINAPSGQEEERAKYLERLLRKYKLEIRRDSARNLIAVRKGTGGAP